MLFEPDERRAADGAVWPKAQSGLKSPAIVRDRYSVVSAFSSIAFHHVTSYSSFHF